MCKKLLTSSVLADEHMTFLDAKPMGGRFQFNCCVQTMERLISRSVYRRIDKMGHGCHVQMDYSQIEYIKLKFKKKVVHTITVAITPYIQFATYICNEQVQSLVRI